MSTGKKLCRSIGVAHREWPVNFDFCLPRQKFPTSNSLPFWLTERSRGPAKMGNIRGDLALQENGASWPIGGNGASSRWGRPVSHCLRVGLPFWLTADGAGGGVIAQGAFGDDPLECSLSLFE